jgi:hypothetical protein
MEVPKATAASTEPILNIRDGAQGLTCQRASTQPPDVLRSAPVLRQLKPALCRHTAI